MSNLGWYQGITTLSKKCGGPLKFMVILAGGGFAAGIVLCKGTEGIISSMKEKAKIKKKKEKLLKTYTVSKDGKSNEGLQFRIGETFIVLECDGKAVLIEKIGDDNNPYFVSAELLKEISDYK